jgi:hypothetical protein
MNNRSPVASRATAVGYQPVGISPRTPWSECPSTSTTAIAFCEALATNSERPFGVTATAFGDAPRSGSRPSVPPTCKVPSAFDAWHGLSTEPAYFKPLVYGTVVSGVYLVACLGVAYGLIRRRDIGR